MQTKHTQSQRAAQAPPPFFPLRELFDKPVEENEWLVEDLLPTGGLSALVAKPKVGKTTLSRQLVLAVARGEPFLGRATTQGPVLYAALQEKESMVRRHFVALGASGDEPIYTHIAAAPVDAIAWLRGEIERVRPVLATIDILFRFIRVRDGSAYNEVLNAMASLLDIARATGTHILVTHHATKSGEGADATLGTTSIFGEVDTLIMMSRAYNSRSIKTEQRRAELPISSSIDFYPNTHIQHKRPGFQLGKRHRPPDLPQTITPIALGSYLPNEGVLAIVSHTNSVEGAFSFVQARDCRDRSIQVSGKHLDRYLDEFEFRFNNRKNPYLFRETLTRLVRGESMSYEKLTATT